MTKQVKVRMQVDTAKFDLLLNEVVTVIDDGFANCVNYAKLDYHVFTRPLYIAEMYGQWVSENWYGVKVGEIPVVWLNDFEFEFTMDSDDATVFKLTHGGK